MATVARLAPKRTACTPKASARKGATSSGTTPALFSPTRMVAMTRPTWLGSQRSCVSVARTGPMEPKPTPQTIWPTAATQTLPVPT